MYQQKVHHLPPPKLLSAKRHFRYVILAPTVSTKITLSGMTAALEAILVHRFDSRCQQSCVQLRVTSLLPSFDTGSTTCIRRFRTITGCNHQCLLMVAVIHYSVSVLTNNTVLFKEPIYSLIVTSHHFWKENQYI